MSENELVQVSKKFLRQNSKHAKTKKLIKKKGGPYTKSEKEKRRDEVYRLHFEYSYSARRIAELMNVSRNTVNSDIDYWRYKILRKTAIHNPEHQFIINIENMQIQIARLRELVDKTKSISEQVSIERLIFDINSKIAYIWQKVADSSINSHLLATRWFNHEMEKERSSKRRISYYDVWSVSDKAYKKFYEFFRQDRKNSH